VRYNEVKGFMAKNHRSPSKYNPEERDAWNWLRHTLKQMNSGELKESRLSLFNQLMEMCERYRRRNQYE
jgi:hypothetical protein